MKNIKTLNNNSQFNRSESWWIKISNESTSQRVNDVLSLNWNWNIFRIKKIFHFVDDDFKTDFIKWVISWEKNFSDISFFDKIKIINDLVSSNEIVWLDNIIDLKKLYIRVIFDWIDIDWIDINNLSDLKKLELFLIWVNWIKTIWEISHLSFFLNQKIWIDFLNITYSEFWPIDIEYFIRSKFLLEKKILWWKLIEWNFIINYTRLVSYIKDKDLSFKDNLDSIITIVEYLSLEVEKFAVILESIWINSNKYMDYVRYLTEPYYQEHINFFKNKYKMKLWEILSDDYIWFLKIDMHVLNILYSHRLNLTKEQLLLVKDFVTRFWKDSKPEIVSDLIKKHLWLKK